MKRVPRGEPNFKVGIHAGRHTSTELHAALSESQLAEQLQKRVDAGLISSFTIEPYDFAAWKKKARSETAKVIWAKRRKQEYDFDAHRQIWGAMKDYLRVLFNGKCAYCDARFDIVAWGDVEHYRPKRKVTDENGVAIDHPGYYWLAYDLNNLLPSCQLCNQAKGKGNRFPLRDERKRLSKPCRSDRLNVEEPLLFNAYLHEPARHLEFLPGANNNSPGTSRGVDFGTVRGIDDVGKTTEVVYDLNRWPLVEARRERQGSARNRLKVALASEESRAITELVQDCREGRVEFSAACLAEIDDYFRTVGLKLLD
jgi:hypothetical protein